MAILKLQVGRQHAISATVTSVTMEQGKFGPQYKFELEGGDTMWLPKDGVERQTARLNLLPNELEGQLLTFSKTPMKDDPTGTKGYINIDLGASGTRTGVASQVRSDDYVGRDLRAAGVPVKATTYEEIVDKYTACLASAVSVLKDAEESIGLVTTPAEVTAVAATLFIERNKRGV